MRVVLPIAYFLLGTGWSIDFWYFGHGFHSLLLLPISNTLDAFSVEWELGPISGDDTFLHSPLVDLSSGQRKGDASFDNPIICVSC